MNRKHFQCLFNNLQLFVVCDFSQRALDFTSNKGVEPAMEWLLAHADDAEVAPECAAADSTNTNEQNTVAGVDNGASSSDAANSQAEVKSFKCEEW